MLIQSIVSQDNTTLDELKAVSPRNIGAIQSWNGVEPEKVESTVVDTFAQQALDQPDQPAICSWDGDFSYREVNELSAKLAHHLIGLGIGPEVLVPVCFEKSAWAIISMLSVMKAGGAYVPLDPEHPESRRLEICEQVNAKVLLVSPSAQKAWSSPSANLVVVSPAMVDALPSITTPVPVSITPRNMVYTIFTSGSSGQPKGVALEHGAICSSLKGYGKAIGLNSTSRTFQFSAYTFDVSVMEIFATLLLGGCVCVPSDTQRLSMLAEVMRDMRVNIASFTPSVISIVDPHEVPDLKTLILGGEAMQRNNVKTWAGHLKLMNGYGPTETCVFSVTQLVRPNGREQTIGRAVGSRSWVVHPANHKKLMPVGCIGELLLEGPTLAREYLSDKTKTEVAFIENPTWAGDFESIALGRLYKTGDLVRYNSDGTLDYFGRKDIQVKFHGQRLELGEIEFRLMESSLVGSAVALLPKEGPASGHIVALVTLSSHSSAEVDDPTKVEIVDLLSLKSGDISRIRDEVSNHLPGYMVPTVWVPVKLIPLNGSAKSDRAKVSRWVAEMDELTYQQCLSLDDDISTLSMPATKMDERLQALLGRVLNIPENKVYMNRSFVKLGGDSITAMQVVTRARSEGISLKVRDILQSKAISELSQLASLQSKAVVAYEDKIDTVFPLTPIQQFYFTMEAGKPGRFNQSFFLRVTKEMDAGKLEKAANSLVQQHSMLRARFQKDENGEWGQLVTAQTADAYHFEAHKTTQPHDITTAMATSQRLLDIEVGPVFAVDYFTSESGDQFLFLVAHHLVVDLISWRVILHDLEEVLTTGALSSKPPLPFQAWSKLQKTHAEQNLLPDSVLPFEVTPANYNYWGMSSRHNNCGDTLTEGFILDVETTSLLMTTCHDALRTESVDLFMATLLHSFAQVFDDRATPTVFTEGHGREPWTADIDVSDTVGWFTTMSPLSIPLTQKSSLIDAIRYTKDHRRILPGNGWPYFTSRFLNAQGKELFSNHMPMEVIFNYMGRYQQLERDDTLLKPDQVPPGLTVGDVSEDVPRLALFEVSVVISQDMAQFSVAYHRASKRKSGIIQWVQAWEQSLRQTAQTLSNLDYVPTLTDFPLLSSINYKTLDTLNTERLSALGLQSLSEVEDIYPCSPMQQGLLLSQSKTEGKYEVDFTHEVVSTREGVLVDAPRLMLAWQQVVDRHPVLRTVFVDSISQEGFSDQVVLKNIQASARSIFCADDHNVMSTLKAQPALDHLEARPRHQFTLCQTSTSRVYFRLEINHAVTDALSMSLLLRDLTLAYESKLQGIVGPRYSDYIKYIQQLPLRDSISYWVSYLSNQTPCHFPTKHDVELQGMKDLGSISLDMSLPAHQLRNFCATYGVTTANVVQTVWGLVLRKYTGSNDVCFGYLSSGRDVPVPGIEGLVGPLINMLVCRVQAEGSEEVADLVQQVQANYAAGLEHQHCSLADIQHGLQMSGQALFNTIMSIQRMASTISAPVAPKINTSADPQTPALTYKSIGVHDPTEVSSLI